MPLIDIVKPLKASTSTTERTSLRVLGGWLPCSPRPCEAPATLAAELESGFTTEATTSRRAHAMRQAASRFHATEYSPASASSQLVGVQQSLLKVSFSPWELSPQQDQLRGGLRGPG